MQRRKSRIITAAAIVLGVVVYFGFFVVGGVASEAVGIFDTGQSEPNGPTSLDKLDLSGNRTTDAGLIRRLKGLTSLRELSLRGTKVSSAGLAELKEALPGYSISGPNLSMAGRAKVTNNNAPKIDFPSIYLFVLVGTFWLWMLVDCIKRPLAHKVRWILLVVLLNVLGAVLYFYIVNPDRRE
ncbi:MAG: PLDc N-terminal domain-containing protein [Planctomycetota bacterium]|jgi:hypothetical protein